MDREEITGTYLVNVPADLMILKGIYPALFEEKVDNEDDAIISEEGAIEVSTE